MCSGGLHWNWKMLLVCWLWFVLYLVPVFIPLSLGEPTRVWSCHCPTVQATDALLFCPCGMVDLGCVSRLHKRALIRSIEALLHAFPENR